MSNVLYRKYRSQNFDQLIGQEHITKILKNAVLQDKLSHAYLLVGSRGTGKTSTARILAKAINCSDLKKGNPCNECGSCHAITSGNYLDLIEIDAASNRGIDQIRELKERIEFSPTEGTHKIYIIDEVHMLTKEAFNALLKTLEEPPKHIIFILATTDVHKLPATILSRCQRYDFRLGGESDIQGMIKKISKDEKINLEDGAMQLLVENAHGSFRDALSLLDVIVSGQLESDKPNEVSENEVRKILGIPDTTMVHQLLKTLIKGDNIASLELISELDSKGVNLQQFVKYVLVMLREILVMQLKDDVDPQEYPFVVDLRPADILHLINLFIQAQRNLRDSTIPSLVLEMIIPAVNIGNSGGNVVKSKKEVLNKPAKQSEKVEENEEEEVVDDIVEEVVSEEVAEEVPQATSVVIDKVPSEFNVQDIEDGWDSFLNAMKENGGRLVAFLQGIKILDYADSVLKIEVQSEFHKERIESLKSRDLISTEFKKIFGFPVKVMCDININLNKKKNLSADVVLKNLPIAQNPVEKKVEEKMTDEKKKKVSKRVEAIFEGM